MFECKVCKLQSFFQSTLLTHLKEVHGCARRGLIVECSIEVLDN